MANFFAIGEYSRPLLVCQDRQVNLRTFPGNRGLLITKRLGEAVQKQADVGDDADRLR